jgi:hypothetical protein
MERAMNIRNGCTLVLTAAIMAGAPAATAEAYRDAASAGREALVKAKSKRFDALYLLPGADFRGYTNVMLDPAQVAFADHWSRNVNQSRDLMRRTTTEEAGQIAERASTGFGSVFASVFRNAGYEVVTAPGADVLRLSPRVVDYFITAPENLTTSPRTRVYASDAGEATLVLEFHDSTTGALLGRAVDRGTAGDRGNFGGGAGWRIGNRISTVSNRADFEVLFATWAAGSLSSVEDLKAQSPVALAAPAPEP